MASYFFVETLSWHDRSKSFWWKMDTFVPFLTVNIRCQLQISFCTMWAHLKRKMTLQMVGFYVSWSNSTQENGIVRNKKLPRLLQFHFDVFFGGQYFHFKFEIPNVFCKNSRGIFNVALLSGYFGSAFESRKKIKGSDVRWQ